MDSFGSDIRSFEEDWSNWEPDKPHIPPTDRERKKKIGKPFHLWILHPLSLPEDTVAHVSFEPLLKIAREIEPPASTSTNQPVEDTTVEPTTPSVPNDQPSSMLPTDTPELSYSPEPHPESISDLLFQPPTLSTSPQPNLFEDLVDIIDISESSSPASPPPVSSPSIVDLSASPTPEPPQHLGSPVTMPCEPDLEHETPSAISQKISALQRELLDLMYPIVHPSHQSAQLPKQPSQLTVDQSSDSDVEIAALPSTSNFHQQTPVPYSPSQTAVEPYSPRRPGMSLLPPPPSPVYPSFYKSSPIPLVYVPNHLESPNMPNLTALRTKTGLRRGRRAGRKVQLKRLQENQRAIAKSS